MLPTAHVIISAVLGFGVYKYTGSTPAGLSTFLSGVFIDLDHHIDYWIANGKIPLSYKKLFNFFEHGTYTKVFIIFHSWELLAILWGAIMLFHLGSLWLGVAIGISVHMLCDQIANPLKPLGYFMVYRIKHKFLKKEIMTDAYFKKNP
jgi:hypothetical protein